MPPLGTYVRTTSPIGGASAVVSSGIEAVTDFPFLRLWAQPLQVQLAALLNEERCAFAALLQPDSLREAAGVRLVQAPEFAGLGNEEARPFRRARHERSLQASGSWRKLAEHDFSGVEAGTSRWSLRTAATTSSTASVLGRTDRIGTAGGSGAQAARAPADGAELVSRLQVAPGKITVLILLPEPGDWPEE